MPKRFSLREMTLLTLPVLAIGALGLWASKRPPQALPTPAVSRKLGLTFQIDKPTALEAFDGAQGVIVLGLQQPNDQFRINGSSTYLELQTPRGPVRLRQGVERKDWGDVWHGNMNGTRFPVRISEIPPGGLSFGATAILDYGFSAITPLPPKPWPMKGNWKINRLKIKAPNIASWPRKPLISLVAVKISSIDAAPSPINRTVSGQAVFRFEDSAMNDKTPLQIKVTSNNAGVSYGTNVRSTNPKMKTHQRTTPWTVYSPYTQNPIVRISGRVSADNRWPLGFQIEPFSFKSVKIGQKLKFKQFPVALPKS